MRNHINLSIIIILAFFCATGCIKEMCQSGCDGVVCTKEFRGIVLSVKDSAGQAVLLDEWYTLSEDNIRMTMGSSSSSGQYTVLNDDNVKQISNTTKKYVFHGFRGKQEIATAEFVVAADCCHIRKVTGEGEVVAK